MEARFTQNARRKDPKTKGESHCDFLPLLIPPELSKLTDDACQEGNGKQLLDNKYCPSKNREGTD